MSQNYGLGRGLASLIPKKTAGSIPTYARPTAEPAKQTVADNSGERVLEIEVARIVPNPHQPRVHFNEEKIAELSASIKIHGIIQPLVVSAKGNDYELIAGERRLQAAKMAGLTKVPAIVRSAGEKEKLELAIVENVQRHDLNVVEEARAYKKLYDEFQMGQEEIAEKMGKSRSAVANKLRLLNLPVEIQRALSEGKITEGHAKAILAVASPEKQRALFEMIIKGNLTVRQVEDKTKEISVKSHKRTAHVDPEVKELEEKLMGIFGTKVKVSKSGGGGKIMIDYYSQEELNNIIDKISQ